jgi:hypothetical protein
LYCDKYDNIKNAGVGTGMALYNCNPSTQDEELRRCWPKVGLDENMRPYLKNKLKAKVLERQCK